MTGTGISMALSASLFGVVLAFFSPTANGPSELGNCQTKQKWRLYIKTLGNGYSW
jgi:hypothetical protein